MIRKRGSRQFPLKIETIFGELHPRLRIAACFRCGSRYSPLLSALPIERYVRKEVNFEHEVIAALLDANYRRLVDGRSIDISLGGVHNIVAGSDIDTVCQEIISTKKLSAIMADGTELKLYRDRKGELQTVAGRSQAGRVMPLGCFTNTSWTDVERTVKQQIKQHTVEAKQHKVSFVYDGEPGLDNFLADTVESQRCICMVRDDFIMYAGKTSCEKRSVNRKSIRSNG